MEHFNASNSIVRSYTFPYVSSIPCSMDSLHRYIEQLSAAVVYRYNDASGILTCQTLENFPKALTTWFLPINFDLDPYEVSKRIKHIDELCSEQLLASTVPHQIPTQIEEQVKSETRKLCAKLYPTRTSMTFETGGSAVPIEIRPSTTYTFNAEKTYRNVKKLCNRKIERIMKRVIGRRQNNIVLVTDERETLEHSLAHFDDSVTVLSKPGLKLENIMDLLKRHPLYKKGTVFVVMAGTHDLLQPVDEHFWDNEQRIVYRRDFNCDNWLIKQALDLHANILSNTTHDTILFSDLIPISLDIDKKTCHNENRFLFTEDVEKFRFEVSLFNMFTKYHARKIGYRPWNLENNYFEIKTERRSGTVKNIAYYLGPILKRCPATPCSRFPKGNTTNFSKEALTSISAGFFGNCALPSSYYTRNTAGPSTRNSEEYYSRDYVGSSRNSAGPTSIDFAALSSIEPLDLSYKSAAPMSIYVGATSNYNPVAQLPNYLAGSSSSSLEAPFSSYIPGPSFSKLKTLFSSHLPGPSSSYSKIQLARSSRNSFSLTEIEQYRRRLWKRTIVKQYDSNMAKKGAYVDEDSDSDDSIDVCT